MGKHIGSQYRETLKEAGYKVVSRPYPGTVILENEDGGHEQWSVDNHHAGWTIQIGRWGYEFCCSVVKVESKAI